MHMVENSGQAQKGVAPKFVIDTRLTGGACPRVLQTLYTRLRLTGAVAEKEEGFFTFGDSGISIRSHGEGLLIQVWAEDILALNGIRTVVEGWLHDVPGQPFNHVCWRSEQVSAQSIQPLPSRRAGRTGDC